MSPLRSKLMLVAIILNVLATAMAGMPPALALAEDALPSAYLDAGLESESTYESPTYRYGVEWSGDWAVTPNTDHATLVLGFFVDVHQDVPVFTDPGAGQDRLDLWNDESAARVRVIGQSTQGQGIGRMAEMLLVGYHEQVVDGSAELLMPGTVSGDRFGLVHRHHQTDGATLLAYSEIAPLEGGDSWLWIQVVAPEATFEDAYLSALDSVSIDGGAIDGIFTPDEILDASAAASTAFTPADVGIASPTTYVSPQYGYTVEWAPEWAPYGGAGNFANNRSDIENGWDSLFLRLRVGDPDFTIVPVRGQPNAENLDLDGLLINMVAVKSEDEREILISEVVGETAIVLSRKIYEDGSGNVEYEEHTLAADGSAIITASIVADPEDFEFTYTHAAGAVLVEGSPIGVAIAVDDVLAAATSEVTAAVLGQSRLQAIKDRARLAITYVEAYGDAGMTWANTYQSPTYGYEVEWSGDWILNEPYVDVPVTTDRRDGDYLSLFYGYAGGQLEIATAPAGPDSIADLMELVLEDCETSEGSTCEDTIRRDDRHEGAVLVTWHNPDTNTLYATYYGFHEVNGGEDVRTVVLMGPASVFDTSYQLAMDTVEVDGVPIPLLFPIERVSGLEE